MSPKLETGTLDARTVVLGVLALACVGTLAVKSLRPEPAPEDLIVTSTRPRTNGPAPVVSAVVAHDLQGVRARYKDILDADPFKARSFKPKPKVTDRPDKTDKPDKGDKKSDDKPAVVEAATLALRLTGIFSAGDDGLGALLENRGEGKGLYVRPGDKLGTRTIAEVRTDALVVAIAKSAGTAPVETKTIPIGDKVDLIASELVGLLKDVGPPVSSTQTSGSGGSSSSGKGAPVPALSDEKRNEVLERLKNKRKKSLGDGGS